MIFGFRCVMPAIAAAFAATMLAPAANAAGALAVGDCGANGYTYSYGSPDDAANEALRQCQLNGGQNCHVVSNIQGSCAAFAFDQNNTCGAQGWGTGSSREAAENIAIQYCQQYGGTGCTIRRWVCD
jgi:hypothetical protein